MIVTAMTITAVTVTAMTVAGMAVTAVSQQCMSKLRFHIVSLHFFGDVSHKISPLQLFQLSDFEGGLPRKLSFRHFNFQLWFLTKALFSQLQLSALDGNVAR